MGWDGLSGEDSCEDTVPASLSLGGHKVASHHSHNNIFLGNKNKTTLVSPKHNRDNVILIFSLYSPPTQGPQPSLTLGFTSIKQKVHKVFSVHKG